MRAKQRGAFFVAHSVHCVVPDCEQKLYLVWTSKTLAAIFGVQLHRIGDHLRADDVSSYGKITPPPKI